jgi:hypothetical protein
MVYVNAIKQIAKKYKSDAHQLDSNKTDDIRYTVEVPAI